MMDMGCHAMAWFRWMTDRAQAKSIYSDMKTVFHKEITDCDDNTVTIVEFENGVTCVAEDSWAKHGGMDDKIEVYGTKGVSYADLFQGNSALTYSVDGYGYAMEKGRAIQKAGPLPSLKKNSTRAIPRNWPILFPVSERTKSLL